MNRDLEPDEAESQEISVLIVDDDEDDYLIVRDLLGEVEGTKYRLDWIASYDEALSLMESDEYDVYLLDYRLGEHDGFDLLRGFRERGRLTPVILLTGINSAEVDLLASENGATDYLVKQQITAPLIERSIRYAIRHAAMATELHEMATRDALTGLFNRREMGRLLEQETERQRRYQSPLALLMIDIDHFKKVNDEHGHQVGDVALKWVAQHIQDAIRTTDHGARYGGEEMIVIAPQSSTDDAYALAERLRKGIAAEPFIAAIMNGSQLKIPITVSIGVATIPNDAESEEFLVAAADRALYDAKENGRNCTVRVSSSTSLVEPVSGLSRTSIEGEAL